ncbi:MAG: hypothetical protein JWP58_4144 [Hymenobacter sp.]|nr:hypothetical protein [Hymenobacter sp.]
MNTRNKWLLRAALTALALLITTDKKRPAVPPTPKKPAD